MKKIAILLSVIMLLMTVFPAFAEAPAGEAPEGAETTEGDSSGDSAGDSAGEAAGEQGDDASAGDSAGEAAEGEGDSAGSEGEQGAGAEELVVDPAYEAIFTSPTEYIVIEADETTGQAALAYVEGTAILEADGLKFKDLNKNGELDDYEDWRKDADTRIQSLLSLMTLEEKASILFHVNVPATVGASEEDGTDTIWYYIKKLGITHMLDNNFTGTPDEEAIWHNAIQAMAEDTRLGIPMTISSDRQYNVWSSYIDSSKDAAGPPHDPDLMEKIWDIYSRQVKAVGVHVTLQPSSGELYRHNGDDPGYAAEMIGKEVSTFQKNGVFTCTKHYISYFYDPRAAVVDNLDNFGFVWKSAVDAGTRWIMDASAGIGPDELKTDYSAAASDYLRNVLGFEGVLLTDWGSVATAQGIAADGTDLGALSIPERYAWLINNGVDQLGISAMAQAAESFSGGCYDLDDMYTALSNGLISEERLTEACTRILRTKFDLGLFENPYCDPEAALAIAASPEYIAERWEFTDIESIDRARNSEIVELEYQLQTEASVLIRNDGVLPLAQGTKVWINGTNSVAVEAYKNYIPNFGEVVENVEDADVAVIDCTRLDDAVEQYVDDAKEAGKKIVIVGNCLTPNEYMLLNGDAVLYLSFDRTPDHGVSNAGLIHTTVPSVYVEMLFGAREPAGKLVSEVAREDVVEDWADLSGDSGATLDVRMILQAIMLTDDTHTTPVNYGDPLLCREYGMRYGSEAEFEFTSLVVPQTTEEEKYHLFLDVYSTIYRSVNAPETSGEAFTVYAILINHGGDGIIPLQILDGENVIAEKIYAVNGNSWRVIKMDIALEGAGEHVLTVGDLSTVITVE